mmetsp:Transcript_10300/g.28074  ORF Transcript_10300/g.28074 Transcript_10300/m.28074 type:complete len:781 (-) Transcript_10300:505-2847(-)
MTQRLLSDVSRWEGQLALVPSPSSYNTSLSEAQTAKAGDINPAPASYDLDIKAVAETAATGATLHLQYAKSTSAKPLPADPCDPTSCKYSFLGVQDAGDPNLFTVAAAAHINEADPFRNNQLHPNTNSMTHPSMKIYTPVLLDTDASAKPAPSRGQPANEIRAGKKEIDIWTNTVKEGITASSVATGGPHDIVQSVLPRIETLMGKSHLTFIAHLKCSSPQLVCTISHLTHHDNPTHMVGTKLLNGKPIRTIRTPLSFKPCGAADTAEHTVYAAVNIQGTLPTASSQDSPYQKGANALKDFLLEGAKQGAANFSNRIHLPSSEEVLAAIGDPSNPSHPASAAALLSQLNSQGLPDDYLPRVMPVIIQALRHEACMRLALASPVPSLLHYTSYYPAHNMSRTPLLNLQMATADAAKLLCSIKEINLSAPTYTAALTFSSIANPNSTVYGPLILSLYPANKALDAPSLRCVLRALNSSFFNSKQVLDISRSDKCTNPPPNSLLARDQLLLADLHNGTAIPILDAASSGKGILSCLLMDDTPLIYHQGPIPTGKLKIYLGSSLSMGAALYGTIGSKVKVTGAGTAFQVSVSLPASRDAPPHSAIRHIQIDCPVGVMAPSGQLADSGAPMCGYSKSLSVGAAAACSYYATGVKSAKIFMRFVTDGLLAWKEAEEGGGEKFKKLESIIAYRLLARPDDFSLPSPAAATAEQAETDYAAYLEDMTEEEALGMQSAAAAQQHARQAMLAKLMENATATLEAEDSKDNKPKSGPGGPSNPHKRTKQNP